MPRAGGAEFRHSRPRQIACCKDSRQSRRAAGTGALEQPELSELLPQPCRQRLHPAPAIVGPRPPIGAGRAGGRSCAVKISNTLVGRRPPAPCSSLSSLSSRRSLAGRRLHTAPTIVGWGRPRQPGRADDTGPGCCPITPKQSRLAIFFYLDPGTPSRTARGDFGATVGFESYLATRSRSGERPPSARRRRPLAEAQDRSPAQQKIRFSPTPAALRLSVLSLLAHEPWAARPRVPSLLIQVGLAS